MSTSNSTNSTFNGTHTNGNGRLTFWLLGFLATVLTGAGSAWIGAVQTAIKHEKQRKTKEEKQRGQVRLFCPFFGRPGDRSADSRKTKGSG